MSGLDKNRVDIANRLRTARENSGLSQGQVAKLMNYSRPTISEIEAGRRKVSAEELASFCEMYEVDSSWVTSTREQGSSPAVELAARELSKLKGEDLDKILNLLKTLKKDK